MKDTTIDLTDALTVDEHAALCAALRRELELLRIERPSGALLALGSRYPVFASRSQRIEEAEHLQRAARKLGVARCS